MLNLVTRQIFISRDVSFHETIFPFISSAYSPHSTISLPHLCPPVATQPNSTFLEPVTIPHAIPTACSGSDPITVPEQALESPIHDPVIS